MANYQYSSIEFQKDDVGNKWWKPKIDKYKLKELHQKNDLPALLNTILYFSALIIFGYLAYLSWNTPYAIPAFLLYGTFYSFTNA